jgi:hypothetical protein
LNEAFSLCTHTRVKDVPYYNNNNLIIIIACNICELCACLMK